MARMRRLFAWTAIFLCSAAGTGSQDAGADGRLAEAKAAFDEARGSLARAGSPKAFHAGNARSR
jgi:hypothetical protein